MRLPPKRPFSTLHSLAAVTVLASVAAALPLSKLSAKERQEDHRDLGIEILLPPTAKTGLKLAPLEKVDPMRLTALAGATGLATTSGDFNFDVDPYRGLPVVVHPIVMAPGTRGMQPKLSLRVGGRLVAANGEFGALLTGLEALYQCGDAGDLCLGKQRLSTVKGAGMGTLYTLPNDPRVLVKRDGAGYVLDDGNGTRQTYKAVTDQQAEAGPWKLAYITDWFHNYIQYVYQADTQAISDIYYGQDGADGRDVRAIHIDYGEAGNLIPQQVTTRVGAKIVRQYYIKQDVGGRFSALSECVPGRDEKLSCYAPRQVGWKLDDTGNYAVIAAVTNGIGGLTDISYRHTDDGPVVNSVTLYAGDKKAQENHYHFADPRKIEGQLDGFGLSRVLEEGEETGTFAEFGSGKYAGTRIREGAFFLTGDQSISSPDLQTTEDVVYDFIDGPGGRSASFLLSRETSRSYDENNNPLLTQQKTMTYDAQARVKGVTTEEGEDRYTYLDQSDQSVSGTTAGNLVTEFEHKNLETGLVSSQKIHYELDKHGILVGSAIETTKEDGSQEVIERKLDLHGNITGVKRGDDTVAFSFDPEHQTFPDSMKNVMGGVESAVSWEYDPATGQPVVETIPNVSHTRTELDDMGRVISVVTDMQDPETAMAEDGQSAVTTIAETTISQENAGHVLKTETVVTRNNKTGESVTKILHTVTDSLERVVEISSETIGDDGQQVASSSLKNTYFEDGGIETVTVDETGDIKTSVLNSDGQVSRVEIGEYGVTDFLYDDEGRLEVIQKNGQEVRHEYDEQDRLVKKILPGDLEYEYRYSNRFPERVNIALLPSGKELAYVYTDGGKVSKKIVRLPLHGPDEVPTNFTTNYTYVGEQLKTVEYPDQSMIEYHYDGVRLSSIGWKKKPPKNWPHKDRLIALYDGTINEDQSKILTKQFGNGTREHYSWQPDGRLNTISFDKRTATAGEFSPLTDLDYSFVEDTDLLGRELRVDTLRREEASLLQDYQYDDDHQLQAFKTTMNGDQSEAFSLEGFNDPLDQQKIENRNTALIKNHASAFKLTHDGFGNISKKVTASTESQFLFNMENRLIKSSVTVGQHPSIVTAYDYDHLGERIEKKTEGGSTTYYVNPFYEFTVLADGRMQETRYVWDYMGRIAAFTSEVTEDDFAGLFPAVQPSGGSGGMASWIGSAVAIASAALDTVHQSWNSLVPDPVRQLSPLFLMAGIVIVIVSLFEKFSSGKTHRLNSPARVLRRPAMAAVSVVASLSFLSLTLAPTVHAALQSGDGTPKIDQVTYFHHDVRGSVITVSDEAGNRTASVSYHPYGALSETDMTAGNNNFRFKFAGMEYDTETGLYYDHARYYDPQIGKFLSLDPAHHLDDPYAYTRKDPVNYVDPDGKMRARPSILDVDDGSASASAPGVSRLGISLSPVRSPSAADPNTIENSFTPKHPSFFNVFFGRKAVERTGERPISNRNKNALNRLVKEGPVMSLTRFGGYLMSLTGSFVLAGVFTAANVGFGMNLLAFFTTVTVFSGFGKWYTYNEGEYWKGMQKQAESNAGDGATAQAKGVGYRGYLIMGVRRMLWKVLGQTILFTNFAFLNRWLRSEDMLRYSDTLGQEIKLLVGFTLIVSLFGNFALLPYYWVTKEPGTGYDEYMSGRSGPANQKWYTKLGRGIRDFYNRRGSFDYKEMSKGQKLTWYLKYVIQMYLVYAWGVSWYIGGQAIAVYVYRNYAFRAVSDYAARTFVLASLSPAASPITYLSYWRKRSYTLIKKRSVNHPRRSGIAYRLLGPTDGLRILKYDDSSYLPADEAQEVLDKDAEGGLRRRLPRLPRIDDGPSGPRMLDSGRRPDLRRSDDDDLVGDDAKASVADPVLSGRSRPGAASPRSSASPSRSGDSLPPSLSVDPSSSPRGAVSSSVKKPIVAAPRSHRSESSSAPQLEMVPSSSPRVSAPRSPSRDSDSAPQVGMSPPRSPVPSPQASPRLAPEKAPVRRGSDVSDVPSGSEEVQQVAPPQGAPVDDDEVGYKEVVPEAAVGDGADKD